MAGKCVYILDEVTEFTSLPEQLVKSNYKEEVEKELKRQKDII
jgi:hypothetical protein